MDKYIVTSEYHATRLDKYATSVTLESRVAIQRLIKDGKILVNEQNQKSNYKVVEGDVILIGKIIKEQNDIIKENIPIEVVYEDNDVIIINKPSGMVVHPAAGNYSGTLVNALLYYADNLSSVNGDFRPGIVHRIDKDTSGLLMVAKNDMAHEKLSKQLFDKTATRRYIALVHGVIIEDEGEIIAPIGRDPKNRKKMLVTCKNSKEAQTNFKVLERYQHYTLIECKLSTGRTHQIRVHFKYISHPVVGDQVYGMKNTIDTKGQALHAKVLGFIHPTTDEYMEFESELPAEFHATLKQIKGEK